MPNLVKDTSFSGIQKDCRRAIASLACGINKLDMHMSIRAEFPGANRKFQQPADIIGNIATETGAGTMVLSQFMARSLINVEENL